MCAEIGVKNKIGNESLLKISRMKPVIKPTQPHKHMGYHELIFISNGAGTHQIDSETIEVIPPMGFYLRPGQVHCWDFTQIPEGYVIIFKEEALKDFFTTKNDLIKFPRSFKVRETDDLLNLLDQFYRKYTSGSQPEVLFAFLNLVIVQSLQFTSVVDKNLPADVADYYKFKSLVEEQFLQLKQVKAYADNMKISVYKLNAVCRTIAGKKPSEVIKERLLQEAKILITHTHLSFSEIAHDLNFTDTSNFVKFFKSHTRLTPTEYKAKIRGE